MQVLKNTMLLVILADTASVAHATWECTLCNRKQVNREGERCKSCGAWKCTVCTQVNKAAELCCDWCGRSPDKTFTKDAAAHFNRIYDRYGWHAEPAGGHPLEMSFPPWTCNLCKKDHPTGNKHLPRCENCGAARLLCGLIPEEWKSCEELRQCRKCRKWNDIYWNSCWDPKCNGREWVQDSVVVSGMPPAESSPVSSQPAHAKPKSVNCPRCTFLNNPSNNICTMCGTNMKSSAAAPQPPAPQKHCPKCTYLNDATMSRCEICGTSMNASSSTKPPPEKPYTSKAYTHIKLDDTDEKTDSVHAQEPTPFYPRDADSADSFREAETKIRKSWAVDSLVGVFSEKEHRWFDGIVSKITVDEDGEEWLEIEYCTDNGQLFHRPVIRSDEKNLRDIRESWAVGSLVGVYSESQGMWFDGKVSKITVDEDGEWLEIEYYTDNGQFSKQLIRYDERLRDIRKNWVENSAVEIFSERGGKWFVGKVIAVDVDEEGEWLTIQYGKGNMFTDIMERYDVHLRPHTSLSPLISHPAESTTGLSNEFTASTKTPQTPTWRPSEHDDNIDSPLGHDPFSVKPLPAPSPPACYMCGVEMSVINGHVGCKTCVSAYTLTCQRGGEACKGCTTCKPDIYGAPRF